MGKIEYICWKQKKGGGKSTILCAAGFTLSETKNRLTLVSTTRDGRMIDKFPLRKSAIVSRTGITEAKKE